MLPMPSQTVNSDDAVRFQRFRLKRCREDSLDCMIFVGRTVIEWEETTSLFYSLAPLLAQTVHLKTDCECLLKTLHFHSVRESAISRCCLSSASETTHPSSGVSSSTFQPISCQWRCPNYLAVMTVMMVVMTIIDYEAFGGRRGGK
jgi:hypothetical protein